MHLLCLTPCVTERQARRNWPLHVSDNRTQAQLIRLVNLTTGADGQKEGRKRKAKKKSESFNSKVGVLERVYWFEENQRRALEVLWKA